MSRYTFNPKLDPNRDRNRRVLIGAIAFGAVIVLGIALLIFGISQLTSSNNNDTATDPAAAPTMEIGVTIFAPVATPQDGAAPAEMPPPSGDTAAQAGGEQAAATAASAPMDPRGKIEGIDDFSCKSPRPAPAAFGYGIQSNWSVGDIGYWNSVMAEQLKLNWTRAKINWYEYEPEKDKPNLGQFQLTDAFVSDANQKGLNIVLTITQPPQWTRVTQPKKPGDRPSPPEDVNEGIRFFNLIAARYKGCVQAIEVLNEPNLDREWVVASGELKAADYVDFLRAVTPGMREIDPTLLIVMAAPSPTGANIAGAVQDDFAYIEDFVKAGGAELVDCIGVHLNGYNMPPDKRWDEGYNDPTAKFRGPFPDGGPHHSWSFISTIEGYRERTNKPMCVTEFGWATAENLTRKDGSPVQGVPPGFDFALDNTEAEQAEWIVKSFNMLRDLGYVRFASVFNLDFIQKIGENPDEPRGDPALYSIIRQNGAPRPAFEAIRDMEKP
jgi:hypothetical protein